MTPTLLLIILLLMAVVAPASGAALTLAGEPPRVLVPVPTV